jgi:hypothetical protein
VSDQSRMFLEQSACLKAHRIANGNIVYIRRNGDAWKPKLAKFSSRYDMQTGNLTSRYSTRVVVELCDLSDIL